MIKVVTTLRKRPDLSTEQFREYYESHHRLIGEKYLRNYASRYFRRYLDPLPDSEGNTQQTDFDVLLEIWFANDADFKACNQKLSEPEVAQEIILDEEKLFDRSAKRSFIVSEFESDLTAS